MSDSIDALRRANPRATPEAIDAAAANVRARIATALPEAGPRGRRVPRRALAGVAVVGASAGAVTLLTSGSPEGPTTAHAALAKAATVTASSAERSGLATVRITHDGQPWAASTVQWGEGDVAIRHDGRPRRPGAELRVVDGTLYGTGDRGEWVEMGDPSSIDPDSGTTPAEYLAAVREDVGGDTLRRLTGAMSGLTRAERDDGSVVFSGTVTSAQLARETGYKDGERIRVLPFGYVANDEAADPSARLRTRVTTGTDGVVREIAVRWGTWHYTVSYSGLGATPAPVAPENAQPLRRSAKGAGR